MNLLFTYIKGYFIGQMLWLLKTKNRGSKFMRPFVICKSLIDFILFWFYFILLFPIDLNHFILYKELEFLDWPSIYAHSPAGVMYIVYGLVVLVHRNI